MDYTFNMHDPDFIEWCVARGKLNNIACGEDDSERFNFVADHTATQEQHFSSDYFRYAEEYKGKSYRFTDAEMESDWHLIQVARQMMQVYWDDFIVHCFG